MNFHEKCDNIPNTLVVIKSNKNRRFGGFTSEVWESDHLGKRKADKNAFLFSLDKKKFIQLKKMIRMLYMLKMIMGRLLDMEVLYI